MYIQHKLIHIPTILLPATYSVQKWITSIYSILDGAQYEYINLSINTN